MRQLNKILVLILILFIFQALLETSIIIHNKYANENKRLFDFSRNEIINQKIHFEDEIYTLKEKALVYRIQTVANHIQAQSKNSKICVSLRTIFDDQDFYTNSCSDNHDDAVQKTQDFKFWIGKELAATFYVMIDTKFNLLNYFDQELIIGLLIKLPLISLMLVLVLRLDKNRYSQEKGVVNEIKPNGKGDRLTIPNNDQKLYFLGLEDYKFLVELLKDSLSLWEKSTNKDKISLATESKLWTVSIDKGSLRTVTLDKYLNEKKIPKNARIKIVIDTANFVVKNTKGNEHVKSSISERIQMCTERYLEPNQKTFV